MNEGPIHTDQNNKILFPQHLSSFPIRRLLFLVEFLLRATSEPVKESKDMLGNVPSMYPRLFLHFSEWFYYRYPLSTAQKFILISKRVSGSTLRCSEDGQKYRGALPTVSRQKLGNSYPFVSVAQLKNVKPSEIFSWLCHRWAPTSEIMSAISDIRH
jgi:hypothetical protein